MTARLLLTASDDLQHLPFDLGPPRRGSDEQNVWDLNSQTHPYQSSLVAIRKLFAPGVTLGLVQRDRPIRAVFMDMDSTVVEQESIVEMARTIGKADEVSRITEDAMAGLIDFNEALARRLGLLVGVNAQVFETVRNNFVLTNGMSAFAGFCRKANIPMYLVSGGFTDLAEPLAQDLGFTKAFATRLEQKDGRLTGKVAGQVVDRAAKGKFVQSTMQANGWRRDEIVVVGDGANDIDMMNHSDFAVGFRPKPVLYPHINVCLGVGGHKTTADLIS